MFQTMPSASSRRQDAVRGWQDAHPLAGDCTPWRVQPTRPCRLPSRGLRCQRSPRPRATVSHPPSRCHQFCSRRRPLTGSPLGQWTAPLTGCARRPGKAWRRARQACPDMPGPRARPPLHSARRAILPRPCPHARRCLRPSPRTHRQTARLRDARTGAGAARRQHWCQRQAKGSQHARGVAHLRRLPVPRPDVLL